ncbi:MAG: hypothetical protein K9J74_06910 [Sulfuritalea sp.]|nr:hypothetical protein [Sulfuritalea sp.]
MSTAVQLQLQLCWLALAIAAVPGVGLAQTRIWVGEVQSKKSSKPVELDTVTVKREGTVKSKKLARHPVQSERTAKKIHSKSQAARKIKTESDGKPQTTLTGRKKSLPSHEPPLILSSDNSADRMEARWKEIQATIRPAKLIELCRAFENDLPASQYASRIKIVEASARRAIEIQHSAGLSGDFFEDAVGDERYRENLRNAVRGDKEAAYRIAQAYKNSSSGVAASTRRVEQWLRFSAELGNGLASWELSKIYNHGGFVADAARFEQKALDQGYRPPPRLPTRGY